MLQNEKAIYELLGQNPFIVKSFGLETVACHKGLKLERAPKGSLRSHILNSSHDPPPILTRLRLARGFADAMMSLFRKDAIWEDVSTRNALLFGDLYLKICDFGDSFIGDGDKVDQFRQIPGSLSKRYQLSQMEGELLGLGCAVFEITEWKLPYLGVSDDETFERISKGKFPDIPGEHGAGDIIRRCWRKQVDGWAVPVLKELEKLIRARELAGEST